MAGIQLSGLISGSFDWQSVVSQLIAIDSTPITNLQTDESTNNTKISALAQLKSDYTALQTASTGLQADGVFNGVTASSSTANSTWLATADNGTPAGNYTIAVTNLATPASLTGASNIGSPLSPTSNVAGLTMATIPTASAPTAGTFTVDGQTVTVALTDTLQDVFNKISTATNGNVTASYNPSTDEVTLASADQSEVLLGAANDTSNFLSAMRLSNNDTGSVTSSGKLGSVAMASTLADADLRTPLTGQDASGNGTFTINGVSISYNTGTSTLATVMTSINNSSAGVTASFDPTDDRMILTNNSTGDVGLGVADTEGNLMASLGLTTGSTFNHGANATFSINGGAPTTSQSNVLSPVATGIAGLTVTVDSDDTQTIGVTPNTTGMNTAIQNFITAYNTLQGDIGTMTSVTTNAAGDVTASTLTGDQEVSMWSGDLQNLAFNSIPGLTGDISSLDQIGIGFTGTSPLLSVTDQATLTTALSTDPTGVGEFFQDPTKGLAAQFNTYIGNVLNTTTGDIAVETNTLNSENTTDANQITALQAALTAEQTNLDTEFEAMQTAQSQAQSDESIINGLSGTSTSSSSSSSSSSTSVSAS
jgi:flagellar hook-associated protein 2